MFTNYGNRGINHMPLGIIWVMVFLFTLLLFYFFLFLEFEVWLKLKEKNKNIRYIKTGHKIKKDDSGEKINLLYFNCARSGKLNCYQNL